MGSYHGAKLSQVALDRRPSEPGGHRLGPSVRAGAPGRGSGSSDGGIGAPAIHVKKQKKRNLITNIPRNLTRSNQIETASSGCSMAVTNWKVNIANSTDSCSSGWPLRYWNWPKAVMRRCCTGLLMAWLLGTKVISSLLCLLTMVIRCGQLQRLFFQICLLLDPGSSFLTSLFYDQRLETRPAPVKSMICCLSLTGPFQAKKEVMSVWLKRCSAGKLANFPELARKLPQCGSSADQVAFETGLSTGVW